jgi:hypothetical protein
MAAPETEEEEKMMTAVRGFIDEANQLEDAMCGWPGHAKAATSDRGTPGRRPKAAGDEREVTPCGWRPISTYLRKCD